MHKDINTDYWDCYKQSQEHVGQLQVMLEYTYNKQIFWKNMFWFQVAITYLILMFN